MDKDISSGAEAPVLRTWNVGAEAPTPKSQLIRVGAWSAWRDWM